MTKTDYIELMDLVSTEGTVEIDAVVLRDILQGMQNLAQALDSVVKAELFREISNDEEAYDFAIRELAGSALATVDFPRDDSESFRSIAEALEYYHDVAKDSEGEDRAVIDCECRGMDYDQH